MGRIDGVSLIRLVCLRRVGLGGSGCCPVHWRRGELRGDLEEVLLRVLALLGEQTERLLLELGRLHLGRGEGRGGGLRLVAI